MGGAEDLFLGGGVGVYFFRCGIMERKIHNKDGEKEMQPKSETKSTKMVHVSFLPVDAQRRMHAPFDRRQYCLLLFLSSYTHT